MSSCPLDLRARTRMMGFGFEFETDADGVVRSYWKEGVNVGARACSSTIRRGVTAAVLAVGEKAAWGPIKATDEAVWAAQSESS